MNDEQLVDTWTALGPTGPQRRRIDARVEAWLDARDTTLAREWLELFAVAPVSATALAAVSAVAVGFAIAPPLLWLTRALL